MFENTVLGFCAWDIPALIVLVGIIAIFAVRRHKQKKMEREYEDELSDLLAQNTVNH